MLEELIKKIREVNSYPLNKVESELIKLKKKNIAVSKMGGILIVEEQSIAMALIQRMIYLKKKKS